MADKIQIKRSSVEGKKPTAGQLAEGELALNLKDKKIYAKDSEGAVQEFPAVDAVDVGVQKVNDLTGEIDIKGSDNISVTKSGQDLTLDVKGTVALKSDLPEDLNLTGGDGIKINGSYPNLEVENEVTKIDDLSDVDTTTNRPQANAVLVFNGTNWVPGTGGGSSDVENLPDLGDVDFPENPTQGQVLQYTDGKWKNVDVEAAEGRTTVNTIGGAVTIKGTAPITVASPTPNTDNEIIIGYSGNSGGGKETLAELTDTTISNPDEDQFLRWSGDTSSGKWVNEAVTLSSAPDNAQENVQSDWNATEGDAFIKNKPTIPTDTGIVKLTHGNESVTGGDAREVTFKSSDASVQFALNSSNEIDFTVPLAGLNIKGVVQYALPQTQADGKITVNGTEYEVLWDPATYLDDVQSGVVGAALGDLWIIQYQGNANDEGTVADGNGYVYSLDENGVAEWSLVGPIQGPPGDAGLGLLPIYDSTEPAKVDGTEYGKTVELSAPDDFQFAISTRDPTDVFDLDFYERIKVQHNGVWFSGDIFTDTVQSNTGSSSIALDANFTVSTGGSESFKIAANKYATFQGHVGVMSPAYSTASVALQGEVKPVNAGGAFGLWVSPTYVVDPDAAYAKHARAFASVKAPANGQAFDTFTQFYASAVCGNTVGTNFGVYVSATGAINNVGCCVTAGGLVEAGNWGFYDNTGYKSFLQGGLKTPSVSGIAANDASIGLGTNFTVSTGGAARVYVRNDGNIGHGYAGQANVNFGSYMGFGSSTIEEMGFLAAPKFDSQPSTSMVAFESQPEFGEGIKATKLTHFRANDSRSTNKPLDVVQRGFYTQGLTLSTVGNRGFEANENIEVGKANYSFVAGGTAPSIFNGDVQVNKLVGADNPATNASVELGANVGVSTGAFYLNVGNPAKNITIGDNTSEVAGGDGVYIMSRNHDLAFSSDEIRFNSNWTDGASEPTWVMTEDSGFVGNNNFNYIKCGSISGTISDDASISLDVNLSCQTNGQATLQKNDGSAYTATSSDSLMTKSDVTAAISNLAVGFPVESLPNKNVQLLADDATSTLEVATSKAGRLSVSDTDIKAAGAYAPQTNESLVTVKYLSDYIDNLTPDPEYPTPPGGSGSGLTWEQITNENGLWLSAIYPCRKTGRFSIVGFKNMDGSNAAGENGSGVNTLEPVCYHSVDGRTWTEGFVGGDWRYAYNNLNGVGRVYALPTLANAFGRYCDGPETLFVGNAYSSTGTTWQGFGLDTYETASAASNDKVGKFVSYYYDGGFVTFSGTLQSSDGSETIFPNYDGNWPDSPAWITGQQHIIRDLASGVSERVGTTLAAAYATTWDVAESGYGLGVSFDGTQKNEVLCVSPKAYFDEKWDALYHSQSRYLYRPIQDMFGSPPPTSASPSTYFKTFANKCKDAAAFPDGSRVLLIDADDNQLLWMAKGRTTLTQAVDSWGETALLVGWDNVLERFVAVFPDFVLFLRPPASLADASYPPRYPVSQPSYRPDGQYAGPPSYLGGDNMGGNRVTFTLPKSGSWTQLQITQTTDLVTGKEGSIYILMDETGATLRYDTTKETTVDTYPFSATGTSWEDIGINSPAMFTQDPMVAGVNGRFIVGGGTDVPQVDKWGNGDQSYPNKTLNFTGSVELPDACEEDYKYSYSEGDVPATTGTTTEDINLTNPEDPNFFTAVEREEGRKSTAPKALLTTQEDANQYFAEEIAENAGLASDAMNVAIAAMGAASSNSQAILEKATVVTLTQAEYDALSPPDENTLYLITS